MNTSIHYSNIIFKIFLALKLHNMYQHIISAFTFRHKGKTKDFTSNSESHRTTIAHFLNAGNGSKGNKS